MEHKGPLWLPKSAADAMLIIDSTGRIVLANRPVEALFGHAQADLLALSVEDLIPPRFRPARVAYRQEYARHPHGRVMGTGRELYGPRKDGSEFAADAARYAAKEQGRNRVHLHQMDDAVLAQQRTQMQWISRLKQALAGDGFCLYRQAIMPLAASGHNRPYYEILLRLKDEEGCLVEPMAFVSAAERYDLMPAIDRWVVREVVSRHAFQQRQEAAAERQSAVVDGAPPGPQRPVFPPKTTSVCP